MKSSVPGRWAGAGALAVVMAGFAGLLAISARPAAPVYTIGSYATDLAGRTPHQRFNASKAAALLNGAVVAPGAEFSFNHVVKGWSADRGFLRAPVSYDGRLIDAYGGGVCETSTTLYNAALLAGLPVLERHPHTFAPGYIPPGRDAAVAYENIDLRFRNRYPWPLTIRAGKEGHMLVCRIEAGHPTTGPVKIVSSVMDRFDPPSAAFLGGPGFTRARWRVKGRPGLRVLVYRVGAAGSRELLSDDTYLAIPGRSL